MAVTSFEEQDNARMILCAHGAEFLFELDRVQALKEKPDPSLFEL